MEDEKKVKERLENYSYSKIETYEQCHYKFKLKYKDKKFLSQDTPAIAMGLLIHKVNEIITSQILGGQKIDYDMLKDYFLNVNLPKKNSRDRDGDMFGVNILSQKFGYKWVELDKYGKSFAMKSQQFLESGIYRLENYLKENPNLELVAAELPFKFKHRKYEFHGFIDRVLKEKDTGKYIIHDLKTSSEAYSDDKCITPLQFVVYVKALKQMYGEQTEVDCFYEFPIAEAIKHAGTKGFVDRGMKKINNLLDSIESEDYVPHPTPLCYWCEFCNNNPDQPKEGKNCCPYHSLWKPEAKSFATKLPWINMESDEMQRNKLIMLENLSDDEDDEI